MPATRRKAPAPTAASSQSSQQSTLSFNNKASRVTKATNPQPGKKSKLSQPLEEAIPAAISTPEPETRSQTATEVADVIILDSPAKLTSTAPKRKTKRKSDGLEGEVQIKASKVTDAQIKKYWKTEEDSRLAPRSMSLPFPPSRPPPTLLTSPSLVHQSTVPLPEKILRHFDLSSQYGPCIGIPRLRRWARANRLDLDPPIEVLAILLKEEAKSEKGQERDAGSIAYIDELGGGGKGGGLRD